MKRVVITAVLLVAIAGCWCVGADRVRVALDWTPNTNHTGLLVARDLGFYTEDGIDLRVVEPGPTVALQLVALGQAEFGISSQEYVTMARAQGIPVVSVAALYPHNTSGFASAVDRKIQSPSDFVGKSYGSWGSEMEELMIRTVMELDGADPETVEIIHSGTIDFTTAVRLDVADFYWVFYGWQGVHAELVGIEFDFLPLRELAGVLDYYTPVLIARERLLEDAPELVARFLRGTARGYTSAALDPDAAAEHLLDYAPELDRDLVVASQRWLAEVTERDVSRWGFQETTVWVDFAAWALDNGLIEAAIDPLAAFSNAYLPGDSDSTEEAEEGSSEG